MPSRISSLKKYQHFILILNSNGKIKFFSDNYLIAQNSSREKVVVVSGFGVDADSATSNAAENALNQLVGSIVTSETLVKKRTEIRNGIAVQVKIIKKR